MSDYILTFVAFLGFGLGCGGGVALGTIYILKTWGPDETRRRPGKDVRRMGNGPVPFRPAERVDPFSNRGAADD